MGEAIRSGNEWIHFNTPRGCVRIPSRKDFFNGIRVGNTLSVVNKLLKKTVLK